MFLEPRTAQAKPRTAPAEPRRAQGWFAAILVVAAAMLFLATAPAADARFTAQEAGSSVKVAWGYWHSFKPRIFERDDYHCGRNNVQLDWRVDLGTAMARAELWGCRNRPPEIMLESATIHGLSDVWACGVITHEFGHLLGYEHVSNDKHIMSGAPSPGDHPPRGATWERAWDRCRKAL